METVRRLIVACAAAALSLSSVAHDFHSGKIGVDKARTAPLAAGQKEGQAFMLLTNSGKDDVLVGATCSVANAVELRATVPTEDGTSTRKLEAIPIPANSTLEFKAQGYHLALISVGYSFAPGERIAATLRFASGLELPVEFQVEEESAGTAGVAQK